MPLSWRLTVNAVTHTPWGSLFVSECYDLTVAWCKVNSHPLVKKPPCFLSWRLSGWAEEWSHFLACLSLCHKWAQACVMMITLVLCSPSSSVKWKTNVLPLDHVEHVGHTSFLFYIFSLSIFFPGWHIGITRCVTCVFVYIKCVEFNCTYLVLQKAKAEEKN